MSRLSAVLLAGALGLVAAPPSALAAAAKKPAPAKKDDKKKPGDDKKKTDGLPAPRPGDNAASTKKLEETLKKTEEPEEEQRLAPAKIDTQVGAAVTKDELADKQRDVAIEQLKKILPKQKNPEIRADLMFQLAELWWQKSRFVKMAEEMPAYTKAADEWAKCRKDKGDKACGTEPRPNNRKSELYRKTAVDLYAQIIKDVPNYSRLDEILFILAFNKYDYAQGLDKKADKDKATIEAVEQYRKLIALFPKSPYVASSFIQLGNYYFDNNQLAPARKAFEEAAKLKEAKTETYALYKLGWCDINSGDWQQALARFKEVVTRGTKADKTKDDDKIKLKSEALRDLIRVFGELGSIDQAIKFYQEQAGQNGSWRYIKNLADWNFSTGGEKYDSAMKIYRYMIKEKPLDRNAPEWQSKIVLALDKQHQRAKVLDEMKVLVASYKPGQGASYQANKNDTTIIRIAYSLTEEALYNLVTDYHQEALKTKEVPTYKLARDIYREYVENFPDSERAYQMRFYYAEILYSLEEYQTAYEQYLKVTQDKEHDDYKKVSATNMLLAAEKLVDIEAGRYTKQINDSGKKIDESADKGKIEAAKMKVVIDKNSQPQKLTELETQLVAACDRYTELVPDAEDESRVRLRAAVIYFDRIQYVEAARRFGYIINKWPEDKTSATAASLILESLEVKEEWASLNLLSRQFAENKKLLAGGKEKDEFRKKLPVYIEGSAFKIASEVNEKEKDYPKAAKLFREFVAEFPTSKFSPIALYNAFVIYQRANELDTAIVMGEKLVADYPKVDTAEWRTLPGASSDQRALILPLLEFDLAKVYERTADFATAAAWYKRFAKDFPTDDRTPDALFNAAHWYEGLGETKLAIDAYEEYIKKYNDFQTVVKKGKPEEFEKLKLPPPASIFYQEALIVEGTKDAKATFLKFKEYREKFKSEEAWKLLNARYKQYLASKNLTKAEMLSKEVNLTDSQVICDDIVKTYATLSDKDKEKPTSRLAAAHCRFLQLEPEFTTYSNLKFNSPKTLKQDLEAKLKKSKELQVEYKKIVDNIANGDYAIASLVRMAMLPKLFAKSLLDAPIPKNLDEEQQELYRATLESKALEYEEPSIQALELALGKAFELQIYNEWTIKAEDMMKEFKPDAYNDVKEFPLRGTEFFFSAAPPTVDGAGAGGDAK